MANDVFNAMVHLSTDEIIEAINDALGDDTVRELLLDFVLSADHADFQALEAFLALGEVETHEENLRAEAVWLNKQRLI